METEGTAADSETEGTSYVETSKRQSFPLRRHPLPVPGQLLQSAPRPALGIGFPSQTSDAAVCVAENWAALRSPAKSLTFSGLDENYHQTLKS